jgi:DNA-directed RNA polymerase subunit A"
MTRYLTIEEIENIIDFVRPNPGIPLESAMSIVNSNKERLRVQLRKQQVYEQIIPALKDELERTYQKSKLQPGESVGIICAQSIGEKNTQMSNCRDEKIILKAGSQIINTTIGYYIDSQMQKDICIDIGDDSLVKPMESGTQILTVTRDEKLQWQDITELSRHLPHGGMVKVTTQSGRSVTTTLSHSHLKRENDRIVPILASELKIGDRIPVTKRIPIPLTGITHIKVSDYVTEYDRIDGDIICIDFSQMENTIQLDEIFGWFIGAYLAEGNCTKYQTCITNINQEFEEGVDIFSRSVGLTYNTRRYQGEYGPSVNNRINSKILSSLMVTLFGTGSLNKKIPSFVFGAKKEFIASIIQGWMDGDGNISSGKERKLIRGFSISRNLIEQMAILLSYFGIFGTIGLQNKKGSLYQYVIHGREYCQIYLNEIGTKLLYKQEALLNIMNTEDSRLEMIPTDITPRITRISSSLKMKGHSRSYATYERNKWDIRRNTLKKMMIKFEEKGVGEEQSEDMKALYQAYTADIVWDKIVSIEEVDYKYKYVYDFSVKGNETFALQSGIIVHNTLNSVDWSEKLLYTKNGKAVVEPIGQLIDRSLEKNSESITLIKENRTQYLPLPDGYYIPSCDEDGICAWYKIEAVTKHLPVGQLVKVTTQSGRSVTATQAKSFLVWNGQKFADTLGSDIKVGDALPTTHTLPKPEETLEYFDMESIFPKNKYLYTKELVKSRKYRFSGKGGWNEHNGNEFTVPYKRPDTCFGKRKDYFLSCEPGLIYIHTSNSFVSHIPDKIPLDNDFGFFVGLYLAEGWCTSTFVGISNHDEIIRKRISDFCDQYGVTYQLVISKSGFKGGFKGISMDLKIHSTLLARMFKIICNTGSENKRVPEFAYTAPVEFIKGLIDGYFSGDGSVDKKSGSVSASSVSKGLITGISFLLSYFGIFGKITKKMKRKKKYKDLYFIVISNGFAQQFAEEFSLTEARKQEKLHNVTLIKKYRYEYGKYQVDFPKRNVYFDNITSVEYVDGTTEYVYDLTVEKTRNFQLYNGLNCADTFHRAGQSEKAMIAGVPRFQELLNATQKPKLVSCKIFFKEGNETIQKLRETIGNTIVGLTFQDVSKSMKVIMRKEPESWYEPFKILYNDEFTKYTDCICIKLNMDILFEYKLTIQNIADVITREYDDLYCVFSPSQIGRIDIFVDVSNIELPDSRIMFVDSDNAPEIYLEELVLPLVSKMLICGIHGITNIYYTREDEEWMVETEGSNFRKLLAHPGVDMSRVISNNVWEIYETLGIEAAREFLIEEYMSIMEGINICHTKLLVERMTFSGTISSISRYTMRKEEAGPFCKASFEESVDNFLKAAAHGDTEPTRGVSASIMCGKRANIGTGMMELKIDIMKLPRALPIIKEKVEEVPVGRPLGTRKLPLKKEEKKEDDEFSEFVDV